MMPNLSYQFADSSLMKKKFESTSQEQDSLRIELLEEVDEMNMKQLIKLNKKKKISASNLSQQNNSVNAPSLVEMTDTNSFGVKEEALTNLPTREKPQLKSSQEVERTFFEPTTKPMLVENWQIITLLFSLLLVAFAKGLNQNRFKNILKSVVSEQATYEIVRGEKIFFNQTNLVLNVVYLGMFSLYIYNYLFFQNRLNTSVFEISFYFKIIGILGIFYLVKLTTNAVLNFIFDTKELVMEYVYNTSLFNNILGMLLLPLMFLTYFSSLKNSVFFQNSLLLLISTVLLFRILRFIKIGTKKNISSLHIFLYICTLEILPLIVIIKFFIL